MKRIPHGITAFGVAVAGSSIYIKNKRAEAKKRALENLAQENSA